MKVGVGVGVTVGMGVYVGGGTGVDVPVGEGVTVTTTNMGVGVAGMTVGSATFSHPTNNNTITHTINALTAENPLHGCREAVCHSSLPTYAVKGARRAHLYFRT